MTDNEKRFKQKVEKLTKVYVAKNKDYGDSFTRSLDKRGIVASIVRMEDKMNRIDSLHDKPTTEVDESLVDSLEDLANYAIMTVIWLEKQAEDMGNHVRYWDDDFEDDFDDLFDDDIDDFDEHEFDDLFDDDFDDDYDNDYDDDIDALLYMLSNIDSEDDESEDDIERELDWNDGWHEFDDNDFDDDDEPEDDPDDFIMDGLPKFRIVRRPKGGLSRKDFWDMIRDLHEQEGNHIFDTGYLDMIRYLYGTEGD